MPAATTVLCAAGGKAGAPVLLALGAYDAEAEGEDPLRLRPHRLQFHGEAPPPEALLRETWDEVVTRRVFGQDHPPRWLLVLSFSRVLLIERGKWTHNRLLRFDLDEILGRREDATLKAAAALNGPLVRHAERHLDRPHRVDAIRYREDLPVPFIVAAVSEQQNPLGLDDRGRQECRDQHERR